METPAIRQALRGKMNSLQLFVALLPAIEPDEALIYLNHISNHCERFIELIDELRAGRPELETTIPAPLHSSRPEYQPPPTA